jgi:hypothetical protein
VLRNANIGMLKREPEYLAAKSGNSGAALDMADRLITAGFVESVRGMGGEHPSPVLLPVLAEESAGPNKIPEMFARTLAYRLGWKVEERVVQITRAYRTDSGADHRLVTHPEFAGKVDPEAGYILIDDTLTMGGTLSDLRGFVLHAGGQALGAAVAVAHEGALNLPIRPQMVENIYRKHGVQKTEDFAHEQWGYGIECLTQGEAGHLYKAVSLDALRDRFAAARDEHRRRLDERRTASSLSERLEGSGKGAAHRVTSTQTASPGQDDIVRPGLSVFVPTTTPRNEDLAMGFGSHLRVQAAPEEMVPETPVAAQGTPSLNPEDVAAETLHVESNTGPVAGSNPSETQFITPEQNQTAHMDAFQDVLRDILHLRSLQGDASAATRVPLVAKGLLDYRDTRMPVTELCDKVIDRMYARVPQTLRGPGEAADGADRWVMTPESQSTEKEANLETARMILGHVEQSGIDLNLVADEYQKLMESIDIGDDEMAAASMPGADEPVSALVPVTAAGALVIQDAHVLSPVVPTASGEDRVLTDVEYQELQAAHAPDQAETEVAPGDEDDEVVPTSASGTSEADTAGDEDKMDYPSDAHAIAANLMLLAMHTRSVRSRKEIKRSDQQQGAKQQAAAQIKAPEKAADEGPGGSTQAAGGGFRLPNLLPRLPRIHVGEFPMDMEAFIRNRRTGQMLATKDSLLKMDRLMHLRQKTEDPATLDAIDQRMGKEAKRLFRNGRPAFDEKGLDLMARGGADPAVITDTMKRMEDWQKKLGNTDDMRESAGDRLAKALDQLVQFIKEMVARMTGRGSSQEQTVRVAPTLSPE